MTYLTNLLNIPYQVFASLEDVDVYHYHAPNNKEAPYAIWKEENDESFCSDNRRSERVIAGILDYYTLDDMDPNLDVLEQALESFGASWKLTASQFEDETNLIHYSWDWQVM